MVRELLGRGREQAVSKAYLMRRLDVTERDLVKQIETERKAGVVICSTSARGGGYYLPKNRQEVKEFIDSMERRGRNIFASITAAKKLLAAMDGQLSGQQSIPGTEPGGYEAPERGE
ncbi:MAG: hypothetical protein Q4C60_02075 [Eubacteriales bacterium]|nr:hypothetical protein [Eubacteriales bacterium]